MLTPSIKTITLKMLLVVILIATFVMMIVIAYSFRSFTHKIVKQQVLTSAELVKAGLTSHMKAGIMDKREYFLEEIKTIQNIEKIQIIRSPELNSQFGKGSRLEQNMTSESEKVFQTQKAVFIVDEYKLSPKIRALIPYVASKEGRLNCLSCHNVPEGTVLGVLDIGINVSEYRNIAVGILAIIIATSLILIILIIVNTSKIIQAYVKDPLEVLIDKAESAYKTHMPVDVSGFNSLEFQNVAKEINLFNKDIIKTHKLLEEKNQELVLLNHEKEDTLEKLKELTFLDELTGIANRRSYNKAFINEWNRAIRGGTSLSIIIVDIDFFKSYNDIHGHVVGDECLRNVAQALQSMIVRAGDMIARYGGEEFVVILPNTKLDHASNFAQMIRKKVESLGIKHPDSKVSKNVTISLGVASMVPSNEKHPDELVTAADKELYMAKEAGRNCVKSSHLA